MVNPVRDVYITADFGRPGSWAAGYHTGRDFRASVGTRIYATKGGTVIHAGWGGYGSSYGNHVIIQSWHKGKRIQHLYAHLSDPIVRKGQKVKTGQWIAKSGNTGWTTGPHLHYEERHAPFGYYNHHRPRLLSYKPGKAKPKRKKVTVSLAKVWPGKRNNQVKRVQRRLNNRVNAGLPVTGYFGPMTRNAYSEWQRKLGFRGKDADGRPGKTSLRRLGFRVVGSPPKAKKALVRLRNLKPGKKHDDVRQVKRRLRRRGFFKLKNTSPTFGPGVRKAYSRYQRSLGYRGRDANGIPGRKSLRKLGFRVRK